MPDFPSSTSASGRWKLREQRRAIRGANWVAMVTPTIDFLLIAGGGGCAMGGAGAGGYRSFTGTSIIPATQYTITIGAGGPGSGNQNNGATKGVNSSAFGQSATGGGQSGAIYSAGSAGGSGGSAGSSNGGQAYGAAGTGNQGGYSPVEGYNGVQASSSSNPGGGGSGGLPSQFITGGVGTSSSITGSAVTRARGGYGDSSIGVSGANTGNGGSWNGNVNVSDTVNSGGSGVVIVAYPDNYDPIKSIDVGLTYSVSTVSRSGYRVYTFTAGTGTVTF
jgi:hypothetical protein